MSGFLSNIIDRHTNPEHVVNPRLKSIFEQNPSIPQGITSSFQYFEKETPLPEETRNEGGDREFQNNRLTKENDFKPASNIKDSKNNKVDLPDQITASPKTDKPVASRENFQVNPNILPLKKIIPSPSGSDNKIVREKKNDQKPKFRDSNASNATKESFPSSVAKEVGNDGNKRIPGLIPISPTSENSVKKLSTFAQKNPGKIPAKVEGQKPTAKNIPDQIKEQPKPLSAQQETFESWNNQNPKSNKQSLPSVRIHIGRIEIKAVNKQSNSKLKSQNTIKPRISLDQFLEKK